MSGLLRRIRRPGAAEETRTEPIALPEPAHGSAPTIAPDGDPAPVRADVRPLPAGTTPEDLERRSTTGRRGKLRRRARFLRRARELALRDLGGLVYEARRREQDGGKLVADKVARLAAIDEELHGLEAVLGAARTVTLLREPGVGGICPRCGELHASDARFCSSCGLDLTAAPVEPAAAGAATAEPEGAETTEPAAPAGAATGEPAAPAGVATAEPAAPEEPVTDAPTEAQSGNGRAKTADAAAHPAPATDAPDRSA